MEDYTRALEVDPLNSYAFYNRGITRDRKGDYAGAVADFTTAIELDRANADFYHNRGFSLRKQVCEGRGSRAGEGVQAICLIVPGHVALGWWLHLVKFYVREVLVAHCVPGISSPAHARGPGLPIGS